MITRRSFAALLSLGPMTHPGTSARTLHEDPLPPLPAQLRDAAGEKDFFSVYLDTDKLGTGDPGKERLELARSILDAAPFKCRPIDVAHYFRDLGLGKTKFGEEGRPYARGWPRIYNPVIVELFKATKLNPLAPGQDGDDTPWCAAFVNYCIARSRSKDGKIGADELKWGTRSPSSGSFRCFGTQVKTGTQPKEGDIVLWALDDTVNQCVPGQGHVGFLVSGDGTSDKALLVLGGNQSGDLLQDVKTRSDGVFLKKMPVKYRAGGTPLRFKRLHSIRTADFLHSA